MPFLTFPLDGPEEMDLWLPFIYSLIIHPPSHVRHSQMLLGRSKAMQMARQVF